MRGKPVRNNPMSGITGLSLFCFRTHEKNELVLEKMFVLINFMHKISVN